MLILQNILCRQRDNVTIMFNSGLYYKMFYVANEIMLQQCLTLACIIESLMWPTIECYNNVDFVACITECLMWPTIGHDAALVHYRRDDLTKDSNVLVQLPESLILVAIAMILLFLLGFYFFVKGIKFVSKIPPQFYNQPGCFSNSGYSNRRYDSRRYSR